MNSSDFQMRLEVLKASLFHCGRFMLKFQNVILPCLKTGDIWSAEAMTKADIAPENHWECLALKLK